MDAFPPQPDPEPASEPAVPARLVVSPETGGVRVVFGGDWKRAVRTPDLREVKQHLEAAPAPLEVRCAADGLVAWDARLLACLLRCAELCAVHRATPNFAALPEGIQQLIRLARAVPAKKDARRAEGEASLRRRVGASALAGLAAFRGTATFFGECALALGQLLRGRARFRWSDASLVMEQTGAQALPIVALINLLVGLILGFVGAVQLERFGASIYVADLVGIAMVREMGAIMTGIIMCGRTGAAFAAQLGTMKVNEEIDAFRALGISPIEFLVLPRLLALVLMMPLLCVFADLLGILGGLLVGLLMLDLSLLEYWHATVAAVSLTNFVLGISKGAFFGLLVAVTGCLQGMRCGNNAAAVGQATTSAVVLGITAIIIADAVFAVLCNLAGI